MGFKGFRALKTKISVLWYPETVQERLSNGSRNARETLDPVANASSIVHPISWEVSLVSDKEPRRVGHASAGVPERPFPPRLYFFYTMRRAHTRECIRTRARAPTRTKIRSGTLVLARGIIFCPVTFAYIMHRMHTSWVLEYPLRGYPCIHALPTLAYP